MDQDMLANSIKLLDDAAQADNFGAGTQYSENFHLFNPDCAQSSI
jgi:hypothetical protein